MHQALQDLYSQPYLADANQPSLTDSTEEEDPFHISDLFDRAAKFVHDRRGYDPSKIQGTPIEELINSIHSVLKQPLTDYTIKHRIPDDLKQTLERNIFFFSGFKTHHEMEEVSMLLRGDDGGFKPFSQFLQEVKQIDRVYNSNYLRAEYNFATASSQMAVKWHEWAKDGDSYDLQYRTAGDDRVREEHIELNGITLPFDDPFWKEYLPPNGWNCRCTTVQVRKGKYPLSDSDKAIALGANATSKPKQKIFRFNPGAQNRIFPPKHPYFPKNCGNCPVALGYNANSEKCRSCKAIEKCYKRQTQLEKFTLETFGSGGSIESYPIIITDTEDYNRILTSARFFAEKGSHVIITPKFDSPKNCPDYDKIYGSLNGTIYYGKCPDLSIDGKFYEHEGFVGSKAKRSWNNMIKHGTEQSDKLIFERPELTDRFMKRGIVDRIMKGANISEVWVKDGDNITLLYKKTAD